MTSLLETIHHHITSCVLNAGMVLVLKAVWSAI